MTRSTNMEHVEVLRNLSEVCRAAIKAGDWKVDGACDPDAVLRRADSAIAALSAPKPEGEWVLVPREPTPEMLSAAGRLQACECGFIGDMSPMDGEEYAAMLAAAPQPPAEAQPVAWLGANPRTGVPVMAVRTPAPSVMRDFAMRPLYANPPPSAPVGVEAKDAEIEALRAEVDRRTERVIVHRGQALACSESAHAAFTAEKARAERLAEALRVMLGNADDLVAYRHDEDDVGDRPCCQVASYEPHADHCPTHIARAALRDHDQEVGND